jgi:hypothetical protein
MAMPVVDLFDDPHPVMKRTIELMGGPDAVREELEAESAAMKVRWAQDVKAIGRILRAHLYVEHYLTEHLQHVNSRLGDLDEARLTFAQKVHLLDGDWNIGIRQLTPGIKQLNKVRNRLAHSLAGMVTDEDAAVFMSVAMFGEIQKETATLQRKDQSKDPLDVLERFAEFAALCLHRSSSAFGKAYEQAVKEGLLDR